MSGDPTNRNRGVVVLVVLLVTSVVAGGASGAVAADAAFGVTTESATNVTADGASLRGTLAGLGNASEARVYVTYWEAGSESTRTWWTGRVRSEPGGFAANVSLDAGTTYRYRAYAKSDAGTWKAGSIREVTIPSSGFDVTTDAPSAGPGTATVGGDLTLGGLDSATVYVKYWRVGAKETTTNWWTGDARTASGSFETTLDLRANTTYEYRALAQGSDGRWKAGAVDSVTTGGRAFEVSTLPVTVSNDSATVGASLDGLGGADSATVYVRYWKTGRKNATLTWWTGPTVSEPGDYETTLDLQSDTRYAVEALAKDADGTWRVGQRRTFRTPGGGDPPVAVYDLLYEGEEVASSRVPLDTADTLTFDASDSHDPDGEIVSYEWDIGDDGSVDATGPVVNHSFDAAGDHVVRLTVTDDDGVSRSYDLTIHVQDRVLDPVYRVNAGGPSIYENWGPDWTADTESNPASYGNAAASGSGTISTDDRFSGDDVGENFPRYAPSELFRTNRIDPPEGEEMRWTFDVEAGQTYEVRVYLSEIVIGQTSYEQDGPRTFDLVVDGQTVLQDFDTYGELGHDGGHTDVTVLTADDGTLTVEFRRGQRDPTVAAIEIIRVGSEGDSGS